MAGGVLYSVKMRASSGGKHTSGAERIVPAGCVPRLAAALAERALSHSKGVPDSINIKAETAPEPVRLQALPVSARAASSPGRRGGSWSR